MIRFLVWILKKIVPFITINNICARWWQLLIISLQRDRLRFRNFFYWKRWTHPVRLIISVATICWAPSYILIWLGYCIVKYSIKYFFLMIWLFINGYLVSTQVVILKWIGILLGLCVRLVEKPLIFLFFTYAPRQRIKFFRSMKNFFSATVWVKVFFAWLKKFLFAAIDITVSICKWLYWKIPRIPSRISWKIFQYRYVYGEIKSFKRRYSRTFRRLFRALFWVIFWGFWNKIPSRKYLRKWIYVRLYNSRIIYSFYWRMHYVPILRYYWNHIMIKILSILYFFLKFGKRLATPIYILYFWIRLPNKKLIIYSIYKRIIKILKLNKRFYSNMFRLNLKLIRLKTIMFYLNLKDNILLLCLNIECLIIKLSIILTWQNILLTIVTWIYSIYFHIKWFFIRLYKVLASYIWYDMWFLIYRRKAFIESFYIYHNIPDYYVWLPKLKEEKEYWNSEISISAYKNQLQKEKEVNQAEWLLYKLNKENVQKEKEEFYSKQLREKLWKKDVSQIAKYIRNNWVVLLIIYRIIREFVKMILEIKTGLIWALSQHRWFPRLLRRIANWFLRFMKFLYRILIKLG